MSNQVCDEYHGDVTEWEVIEIELCSFDAVEVLGQENCIHCGHRVGEPYRISYRRTDQ